MKVYLSGPMSGIPDFNRPALAAAADKLRRKGHQVFNPGAANLKDMSYGKILAYDLNLVCDWADAIALLPGWQCSKGASAEYMAAVAVGLKVIFL